MAIPQTTLKFTPQSASDDASLDYDCPASVADVVSVPLPRLVWHESDASSDYAVGEAANTPAWITKPQLAVIGRMAETLVSSGFPRADEDASWDYALERRALAS